MNKQRVFVLGGVIVALLLVSIIMMSTNFVEDLLSDGVKRIQITERESGERMLTIEIGGGCSDKSSCSVRILAQDEKVYQGEKLIVDDGLLGEYRIEILFHDVKASPGLVKAFPVGTVSEIRNASIDAGTTYKVRIAYPPDDSMFIIYIGSNEPFDIDEQSQIIIGSRSGKIELALKG